MVTQVIKVDPSAPPAEPVREAAKVLDRGGLVAFPTETVYGVAARADRPEAMERLRAVKTRDAMRAFTVHIATREEAAGFVPQLPGLAARFIRKAWPGPLTLILEVDDPSATPVMAGRNGAVAGAIFYDKAVGLRCPDDAVAREFLRAVAAPVVAASANQAGHAPPWTGEDVLRELGGQIEILLDAGRTKYARPSTIVRVNGASYELLREGVLDAGIIQRLSTLRLLFVCTGNTCRSPIAAGLARKYVAGKLACEVSQLSDRNVVVSSAGTAGGIGPASANAVTVMARRGVDLSDHVSVLLSAETIQQADYIYAMTRAHRDAILRMAPAAGDRVSLLLGTEDVTDPVGGSEEEYERCAQTIERGLTSRLEEVKL